jgi:prolyl oligopeptidase
LLPKIKSMVQSLRHLISKPVSGIICFFLSAMIPKFSRKFHNFLIRASNHNMVSYWLAHDHKLKHLKEVEGNVAMEWVLNENQITQQYLGDPKEKPLYGKILTILDSKDKIPHIRKIGDHYYNFWQDNNNPRGVLRRTTLEKFKTSSPEWEIIIDIDLLGKLENQSWVYGGQTVYEPDDLSETPSRTLISLSPGGSDAKVIREFDLTLKEFVDGGFSLPSGKSFVSWLDKDTILVGTNMDEVISDLEGSSLTDSGYPRMIHRWNRGSDLSSAVLMFEGEKTDVLVSGYLSKHRRFKIEFRIRRMTFYSSKRWILINDDSHWNELLIPEDAEVNQFYDQLLITLRSDWNINNTIYVKGTLLAVGVVNFVNSTDLKDVPIYVLFTPTSRIALDDFACTKNYIVMHTLVNVKSKFCIWHYKVDDASNSSSVGDVRGVWEYVGGEAEAVVRGASISAVDCDENDLIWITTSSFTQPSALFLADICEGIEGMEQVFNAKSIKSLPAQFDGEGLNESQGEAISKDGTRVPYFIIRKHANSPENRTSGNKNVKPIPTLLYGYGGFEISLLPSYQGVIGAAWLEAGYCYVIANIRGGGEFGTQLAK